MKTRHFRLLLDIFALLIFTACASVLADEEIYLPVVDRGGSAQETGTATPSVTATPTLETFVTEPAPDPTQTPTDGPTPTPTLSEEEQTVTPVSTHTATLTPTTDPERTRLPTSTATATPTPTQTGGQVGQWPNIALVQRFSGLSQPVDLGYAKDGSGRIYVAEQAGQIQFFEDGVMSQTPFLDIRDRVICCGERGLLGMAFPPDFASSADVYVNYTTNQPGSLHTRISRFSITGDTHQADPASETILMEFSQPFNNHNGGQIAFGPKGNLWIGTGDGGSGGDPDNYGQRGNTLLGKLLRIDVNPATNALYGIPADNPFVNNGDFLDEIWAYGLRNPWRFSFDRQTGDLYIADVGQNAWEEVNHQPASSTGGENYGWRIMEANHCFQPSSGCSTAGLTLPVAEYNHDNGDRSITGGFVFRGPNQPGMLGIYFYADFVTGRIWGLRNVNGEWETELLLDSPFNISSFGEDEIGNLYVVDHGGTIQQVQISARR